jgi:hypothetical protein
MNPAWLFVAQPSVHGLGADVDYYDHDGERRPLERNIGWDVASALVQAANASLATTLPVGEQVSER